MEVGVEVRVAVAVGVPALGVVALGMITESRLTAPPLKCVMVTVWVPEVAAVSTNSLDVAD